MEVINIKKLIFYRTDEVIRDLGLIYFNDILGEMKKHNSSKVDSILESNCLKVSNFDENEFCEYLIKNKVFQVFLNGIKAELKKTDKSFLNGVTQDDFLEAIKNCNEINEKTKSEIKKKFVAKYLPYMRNSAKYGANSQSEENFHRNFKKLVSIVSELCCKGAKSQEDILKDYESIDRKCIVCHTYKTVKYDITHKNQRKERKNSKYNYLFMGSEENTFSNYAENSSTVCFVCEFFNLMYLLYLALRKPNKIAYTEDLKFMEFINYKLMLISNKFRDKGFYAKLSRLGKAKVKIYDISTDPNKGVLMNFNSVLETENVIRNIKLIDAIDRFTFSREDSAKKKLAKILVRNSNINGMKKLLSSELFVAEDRNGKRILNSQETIDNIELYLEIIILTRKEKIKLKTNDFDKLGEDLCRKFEQSGKSEIRKTVAFKVNQMLKADNRKGLFELLMHLIITNEVIIPEGFSDVIIGKNDNKANLSQKQDELHYSIGKFLEKFLIEKKESK